MFTFTKLCSRGGENFIDPPCIFKFDSSQQVQKYWKVLSDGRKNTPNGVLPHFNYLVFINFQGLWIHTNGSICDSNWFPLPLTGLLWTETQSKIWFQKHEYRITRIEDLKAYFSKKPAKKIFSLLGGNIKFEFYNIKF